MFPKQILLKDVKTGKQCYIRKTSYNLAALNEQQWYFLNTKIIFSEDSNLLESLENINAGNALYGKNHEKLYDIISVGFFSKL